MPSGGLQGSLHFRHRGGILYLDFFAVVCYTPNRTVTVFPQRQLEPIQGKPVVGSFLFPGLTFANLLDILSLNSVSPLPYPTSVGTRLCDTLFFFISGVDICELFGYTVFSIDDGLNQLGQLEPSARKPLRCFFVDISEKIGYTDSDRRGLDV